jgi:hypothetical protein
MRIYRIEDKDYRGPYTSRRLTETQKTRLLYSNDSPGASEDFDGFGLLHVCGFKSLEDLIVWFGRDTLSKLVSLELRLCYYKVVAESVIHSRSGKQVAFIRDYAKGPFFRGL